MTTYIATIKHPNGNTTEKEVKAESEQGAKIKAQKTIANGGASASTLLNTEIEAEEKSLLQAKQDGDEQTEEEIKDKMNQHGEQVRIM
jgi:hypothetical protein